MKSFYRDKNGSFREGNYIIFLECCIDNFEKISKNKIQLKEFDEKDFWIIINDNEILNPEIDFDKLSHLSKENYKLIIQSIIMLCAFLEAFINEIGIVELGSKYYKDNLDSLSIIAKWEVVLKLVYGKGITKSKTYYENFKNLITVRNNLVHYKTKKAILNEQNEINHFEKVFIKNIISLPELFFDFEKINSEKYIISTLEIKAQFQRIGKNVYT